MIYHGRCIPELMQFVNKDFWENQCVVLLQRRTARIEKTTKLVSHESLRLCYTVITQPVQDTVVLNNYCEKLETRCPVVLWIKIIRQSELFAQSSCFCSNSEIILLQKKCKLLLKSLFLANVMQQPGWLPQILLWSNTRNEVVHQQILTFKKVELSFCSWV